MKRKSYMQQFAIWVALIIIVLTSGCVRIGPTVKTYSGDKLQESEVAIIKGWWTFYLIGYQGIDIYSIDGTTLRATKVEVLPGRHELDIRYYFFSMIALVGAPFDYARVTFNFEAGHEYRIKTHSNCEYIDIIDINTGANILTQRLSPGYRYR